MNIPTEALRRCLLAVEEQRIRRLQASAGGGLDTMNARWGRIADLQAAYRRRRNWKAELALEDTYPREGTVT